MGALCDGGRLGCYGRRGAWLALVLTVACALPGAAAATPPTNMMIEDGGSGSTACVNVVTFRYYLCVRADGSVYRIYY